MVFLRWVRVGVLTLSVVLSGGVLALSAALIYARSTESFIYHDEDGPNGQQDFSRMALDYLASRKSLDFLRTEPNDPDDMVLRPSGHDIDTILTTSVAIVNILTVPVFLIVDLLKRKTWLSTLVVEAAWLFVLWSLWLTAAAYTAWCSTTNFVNFVRCQDSRSQCLQYKFLEIFSFINWIALMLYANTLFTIAVINHMRRHPIWFARVREAPRLPPLVFSAHPPLTVDESKAHSLTLTASSSSLLHHHQALHHSLMRYPHQFSDPHSPLLPSIDESTVAPSSPSTESPAISVSRPISLQPPLYTERPDSHAPV